MTPGGHTPHGSVEDSPLEGHVRSLESEFTSCRFFSRERLYFFKLQQYKFDEEINSPTAKLLLCTYLVICCISTTDWHGLETRYIMHDAVHLTGRILRLAILFCMLANFCLLCTGYLIPTSVTKSPSILVRSYCITKYLFWYIGYPVMVWSYTPGITGQSSQILAQVREHQIYGWCIISIGFLLTFISCLFRSHLPTKGKLNTPNKLVEPMIYFTQLATIITRSLLERTHSDYILDIGNMALTLILILICMHQQAFWWNSVDRLFVIGHAVILSIRMAVVTHRLIADSQNAFPYLVFACLLAVVSSKLTANLLTLRTFLRVKFIKFSSEKTKFLTIMSTKLVNEFEYLHRKSDNLEPTVFFQNQVGRDAFTVHEYNKRNQDYSFAGNESGNLLDHPYEYESHDYLWAYYKYMSQFHSRRPQDLKLLLFVQILYLDFSIIRISSTLNTLRKLMGEAFYRDFDIFLLEVTLEARLEKKARGTDSDASNLVLLSNLLEDIVSVKDLDDQMLEPAVLNTSGVFQSKKLSSYSRIRKSYRAKSKLVNLDIGSILEQKNKYLACMAEVSKLIKARLELYMTLNDTSCHKSDFVYQKTCQSHRLADNIDKKLIQLCSSLKPPTYVLAASVSYFLKIRYDIQTSEQFFKQYRVRISKFQALPNMKAMEINQNNFDYNVVVLRISVALDLSLGQIDDISMNYQEHLGEPASGDPHRMNINSLFPGDMADKHLRMMKVFTNQDIFNQQILFQLNGFDGFLRILNFMLKVDSSIKSDLHVLALLRFPYSNGPQLLLTDEHLNILSSDRKLSKIIQPSGTESSIKHIGELSQGLATQMLLHKLLHHIQQNEPESIPHKNMQTQKACSRSDLDVNNGGVRIDYKTEEELAQDFMFNRSRQRVLELYTDLVKDGVHHEFNQSAIGAQDKVLQIPLITKIEETWFGESRYYRVWCSFEFDFHQSTRRFKNLHEIGDHLSQDQDISVGEVSRISASKRTDNIIQQDNLGKDHLPIHQKSFDSDRPHQADHTKGNPQFFSTILRKLQEDSPFMDLLVRARGRYVASDFTDAIDWLLSTVSMMNRIHEKTDHLNLAQNLAPTLNTPFVSRKLIDRPTALEPDNLAPFFDMSESANEGLIHIGNLQIQDLHGKLRNNQKQSEMLKGFGQTTSLAEDIRSNTKIDTHATAIISARNENALYTQVPLHPLINHLEQYKIEKLEKSTTRESIHNGKISKEHALKANIESTTALRAIESKEDLTEEKEVKKMEIPLHGNHSVTDINRIYSGAKARSANHMKSPRTDQPASTLKNYKTAVSTEKPKLSGNSRVLKLSQSQSGRETKSNRIWNLGRAMGQVFHQSNNRTLNSFKKKEQVTSMQIMATSRNEALMSNSYVNLQLISRHIGEYIDMRKMEVSPEEQNHSVSALSRSSSTKEAYIIKLVHKTLQTRRKGSLVYLLNLGLLLFTTYLAAAYQTTISSLSAYNQTNQESYLLISKYIIFQRRLVEAVELQEVLFEHAYNAWDPNMWEIMINSFKQPNRPLGVTYVNYLEKQLSDSTKDIIKSLHDIVQFTISLTSRGDAGNINDVVFQKQSLTHWELRYNLEYGLQTEYREWFLPYLSKFAYYGQLLVKSRSILQIVLSKGITPDGTQASTNSSVIMLQKIKYGLSSTIFDDMLSDLDIKFKQMTNTIVLKTVRDSFDSVYKIVYASIAVMIGMLGYAYYAYTQINYMHAIQLETYSFMKPWEVSISIEDTQKLDGLFTKYAFHEVQLVNQYLDLGLHSQAALLNARISKLQQKRFKDKDKTLGYKFAHNFSFLSSKLLILFIFLNLILFAMLCATFAVFLETNNNRLGIQQIMYDAHFMLIRTQKYYLTPLLMMIYGYSMKIGGKSIALNPYNQTYNEFLQFLTQSRTNYINYFNTKDLNTIETITFGDICGQGRKLLVQQINGNTVDFHTNCVQDNNASATRGIFGYFQFEQNTIERTIRVMIQNYPDWLESSKLKIPSRPRTALIFSNGLMNQRIGHRTIMNLYHNRLEQLTTSNIQKLTSQLELNINQVMQAVSVVAYLLMLFGYWLFLRLQKWEIDRCYEAYKLIDPYFLMSNRYLQHRFYTAFQSHS